MVVTPLGNNTRKGNQVNAVKASAGWVWRPKHKVLDHVSRNNGASITFKRFDYGDPQFELHEKAVIDSGCSRHMTRNMSYLSEVLDLENVKDAQALEIQKLKKRVKRLEKRKKSRTPQLKRRLFKVRIESSAEKSLGDQEDASNQERNNQDEEISFVQEDAKTHRVTTAGVSLSTAEPSTPPTTTTTLTKDEDLTIAQTLMKMRSVKSKEKSKEKRNSHLRIEESLRVQDSDKPKGNNVVGPSVVNMVEHINSFSTMTIRVNETS
nr:zinc finger, CCHC-type [Tanacetum cinerariifolium]